jgi:tetratricopeptide (TPR) repeat protein
MLSASACASVQKAKVQTDYEHEVTLINENIDRVLRAYDKAPSKTTAFEIGYQYFSLASLNGDFESYKHAEYFLNAAGIAEPEHVFSSAYLDYRLHRFENAENKLRSLVRTVHDVDLKKKIQRILADICLQRSSKTCKEKFNFGKSWQDLSSQALSKYEEGKLTQAASLYEQAASILENDNNKNPASTRHRAWIELQRGIMNLEYERYAEALKHFEKADEIYTGYWLIQEHIAETLALLRRKNEAIQIYRRLIDETNNPEFYGALAELLSDNSEQNRLWVQGERIFQSRMQTFREAAAGHFVNFLMKKPGAQADALRFAKEDYLRRPNPKTKLTFAKALLLNSDCEPALRMVGEILSQNEFKKPDLFRTGTLAAKNCGRSKLENEYNLVLQKQRSN